MLPKLTDAEIASATFEIDQATFLHNLMEQIYEKGMGSVTAEQNATARAYLTINLESLRSLATPISFGRQMHRTPNGGRQMKKTWKKQTELTVLELKNLLKFFDIKEEVPQAAAELKDSPKATAAPEKALEPSPTPTISTSRLDLTTPQPEAKSSSIDETALTNHERVLFYLEKIRNKHAMLMPEIEKMKQFLIENLFVLLQEQNQSFFDDSKRIAFLCKVLGINPVPILINKDVQQSPDWSFINNFLKENFSAEMPPEPTFQRNLMPGDFCLFRRGRSKSDDLFLGTPAPDLKVSEVQFPKSSAIEPSKTRFNPNGSSNQA